MKKQKNNPVVWYVVYKRGNIVTQIQEPSHDHMTTAVKKAKKMGGAVSLDEGWYAMTSVRLADLHRVIV